MVQVAAPTGTYATDVASVASAVASAGVGGVVAFQAGTYLVDSLAPASGQTWTGGGALLQRPSASSNEVITATGLSDFTLRGFIIDGARATSGATYQSMVYLYDSTRVQIVDNVFRNTPSASAALALRGSVNGLVTRNRLTNVGYGILVGLSIGDAYSCNCNIIDSNIIDTTDNNAVFFSENLASASAATTIASGSNGNALPQSTINVASTAGFATSGRLRIGGYGGAIVAYTGVTGTAFTGCTAVIGGGTLTTGESVNLAVEGLVQGTVFSSNVLTNYGDCGVEVGTGCSGVTVTGNCFYGSSTNTGASILFRDAEDCVATGNICSSNSKPGVGCGINFMALNAWNANIELDGNTCVGNAYGIRTQNGVTYDLAMPGGQASRNVVDVQLG